MKTSILLMIPGAKGSFRSCVILLYWAFNYLSGNSTKFHPKPYIKKEKKKPNDKIPIWLGVHV